MKRILFVDSFLVILSKKKNTFNTVEWQWAETSRELVLTFLLRRLEEGHVYSAVGVENENLYGKNQCLYSD